MRPAHAGEAAAVGRHLGFHPDRVVDRDLRGAEGPDRVAPGVVVDVAGGAGANDAGDTAGKDAVAKPSSCITGALR